MFRISDESYERVTEILEDIGYACETSDYYEDWEDVARSSFCTMDDLDADCYSDLLPAEKRLTYAFPG